MISVDQQRGAAAMDAHSSRPSRRRDSRHEGTKQWETACLWVRLVWRHWRSSALHVLLRRLEGNAPSFPRACGAQRLGGRRCCARYGRLRCRRGVNPLATKCERSDWVYPRITCGGTGGAMPSSVLVRRLEGNAPSFPRACGAPAMDAHSSRPSRRRDSRHEGTKQWETVCLWVRLVRRGFRRRRGRG